MPLIKPISTPVTIAIGGTGLTALWTAYSLSQKCVGRAVRIVIIGRNDSAQREGSVQNVAKRALYVSPALSREGSAFADRYQKAIGSLQQEQSLDALKKYAKELHVPFQGKSAPLQLRERLLRDPRVTFKPDFEVQSLAVNEKGVCEGFLLEGEAVYSADVSILARGLANKQVLAENGVALPLWRVWEAAMPERKAKLELILPEEEKPTEDFCREKLAQNGDLQITARTETPDGLPLIGVHIPSVKRAIVLNPTSFTQSRALGEMGANHALHMLCLARLETLSLNLFDYRINRFG